MLFIRLLLRLPPGFSKEMKIHYFFLYVYDINFLCLLQYSSFFKCLHEKMSESVQFFETGERTIKRILFSPYFNLSIKAAMSSNNLCVCLCVVGKLNLCQHWYRKGLESFICLVLLDTSCAHPLSIVRNAFALHSFNRDLMGHKGKLLIIWPFTEKVCTPMY